MEYERHEATRKAPPFPIGREAALSAYATIKSCITDRDVLTQIRGEIEFNDPMFLTLTRGFRDIRTRLHLDKAEKGYYMTGGLYGYFATIFQYQELKKIQPILDHTDIDRYFTKLIKPDHPSETTPQFVSFNKFLNDTEKPFAFGNFVWLVNNSDKRPFVQDLQRDFVENSNLRLERFKRTENTLINTGQEMILGETKLAREDQEFNMGIMDAVLPFYYKYQDTSLNSLLSDISIPF